MDQLSFDQGFGGQRSEGGGLDFKRIGYNALKYWYIIIISLVFALTIAYFKNRYGVRIYPVNTSILIRETERDPSSAIFKSAFSGQSRNYYNEPYIIRSYPLIQRVVEELNFGVAFYREGSFMTTEAYDYIPVNAELLRRNGSYGSALIFKIEDKTHYSLAKFREDDVTDKQSFTFGDSIVYQGHHLFFTLVPDRPLEPHIGVPFLFTILNPRDVTSAYVSKLTVKWAEEGAGVINIGVVGPNPRKDIDFLNGLVKHYQEYDLEKKNLAADGSMEFIRTQLRRITDSLEIFEDQLERFKGTNVVTNLGEEAQRLFERVEELEVQKAEYTMRENYYQYLEKYLIQGEGLDKIIVPSAIGLNDPVLNSLISRLIDYQLELKLFLGKDKFENPGMTQKRAAIDDLKKQILESLKTLRSTDKIRADFFTSQIKDIEKHLARLPLAERQLVSIQRRYDLLENLYVFLLEKLSETGISKASNTSDISWVNPPMMGGAISPKTGQNYTIATILGLLIPTLLLVLIEVLNQKIQSKEDIEKLTSIPFIGGVGHNSLANNLIVDEKPKSGVAESFRALRSNLNFFTGNAVKKTFMISSSISGEGKTFTTINLATVFAMSGRKTLIIGADMRKPKIYSDFGLTNVVGLSGYLSKINSLKEVIQKTSIENLDLVSGGPVPPNPSELLLTDQFESFLKEAIELYDYVLIDTPPLALVTDAFVMSKYADHTIFVVRQNYTPKSFIKSIDDYHKTGRLKNVSILLNDIYKSGLGYGYGVGYGYNYGYGYGYGLSRKRKNGHGYYEES